MRAVNASILVLAAVVAIAAAVRGTWSPCGQSMLSQLNPVGEASRGNRYGVTAAWYVVGALVGGAMLGAAMGLLAAIVDATGLSATTALAAAAIAAGVCALVDSGVFGVAPPFFLRQVNEDWLGRYRSWLYASGFGWQVGSGVTTYIMTAAVFLTIVLGALTAGPFAALAIGVLFGLVRGLAVLLTARLRTTVTLYEFHRHFDALGEPVRRAVIAVQLAVAVVAFGLAFGVVAALVAAAIALVPGVVVVRRRRERAASAA
jgi:hypothetical protein